jgi:hypothetical protein
LECSKRGYFTDYAQDLIEKGFSGQTVSFVTSSTNEGMMRLGEKYGFEKIIYPISNGLLKCLEKDRKGDSKNPERILFARRL